MCWHEYLSYQVFAYECNPEHQPCLDVGCSDLCEARSNALVADTNRSMFMAAKTLCTHMNLLPCICTPFPYPWTVDNDLGANVQHCSTDLFGWNLADLAAWHISNQQVYGAMDPFQACTPVNSHLSSLSIPRGSGKTTWEPVSSSGSFNRKHPVFVQIFHWSNSLTHLKSSGYLVP